MQSDQSALATCPKTNTREHWWLRLLSGGRRCYFCGWVEPASDEEGQ